MYTTIMDFLGIPTKTCWTVNRGKGLSPVESCEGKFCFIMVCPWKHTIVALCISEIINIPVLPRVKMWVLLIRKLLLPRLNSCPGL